MKLPIPTPNAFNILVPDVVYYPEVELIAKTQLVEEKLSEKARKDQDQGTDMERLTEAAGRECYDSYGIGRSSEGFHKHIVEVGHGSVLRHVNWTFRISGVSRGLTHELVRHAAGVGISQRSTRYCDETTSRMVMPPAYIIFEADEPTVQTVKQEMQIILMRQHRQAVERYGELVEYGEGIKLSRKQARGAARSVLGTDLETSLVWTCNAQAMTTILSQRWTDHAEAEIYRLAALLLAFVDRDMPAYFVPTPEGTIRRL